MNSVSQKAQGRPANPLIWARLLIDLITSTALHLLTYPFLSTRRILSQTYHHIFGFKYSDRIISHHIRLICLPSSSSSSSKTLTIQTFPLDACPPYIALSYTWGPALSFETPYTRHDRRPISLNGRPFLVLRNLYFALVQLYESRPGEYVWVDSICINQDSLEERAAQVGIMDRVYDGAEATLI